MLWKALPLCAGPLSVKTCKQMLCGQVRERIAPVGRNLRKWGKDKAAGTKRGVRDAERPRLPQPT